MLRISARRRQRRSAIEASKIQYLQFVEDFEPLEATRVRHRGNKNPRPSNTGDFGQPEATTIRHTGFKKPKSSTSEDFDPPEATMVRHRGFKNPSPSIFQDLSQSGRLVCAGMGPDPACAQQVCHTCLGLQDLRGSISPAWVYKSSVGL